MIFNALPKAMGDGGTIFTLMHLTINLIAYPRLVVMGGVEPPHDSRGGEDHGSLGYGNWETSHMIRAIKRNLMGDRDISWPS